jgi:hypothetical protein
MNGSGGKLTHACWLTGKTFKIIVLTLFLLVLVTGIPPRPAYSWGAFVGFVGYFKAADTHQQILQAAYLLLIQDPDMRKPGNLCLADGSYIGLTSILQYEGVQSNYLMSVSGFGPDAEGASPYSWHWYNPSLKQGKAPQAASKHYYDFVLGTLMPTNNLETVMRGMTWSAHFLADMFVPVHVNGMDYNYARRKFQNKSYILNADESGPLYLCNMTPSLTLPDQSGNPETYEGFGLNSNFKIAYMICNQARYSAGSMDDPNNPIDWFDPWYWNSAVSPALSSHATFEANAHNAWQSLDYLNTPKFAQVGKYDHLWKNGRPDYEFRRTATFIQAAQVDSFACKAARRTKVNTGNLFLHPTEGIKQSVFAVYTLWRSAWSALEPVVYAFADMLDPQLIHIKTSVKNYTAEPCRNVVVQVTVMEGERTVFQDRRKISELLPLNSVAEMTWNIRADQKRNYIILAEVVGAYSNTPDLQYDYSSYSYQPVNLPPPAQENVFGDNNWSEGSLQGYIYYLREGTTNLPDFSSPEKYGPIYTNSLNIPERPFDSGFPSVSDRFEWFAISYNGVIRITPEKAGWYTFILTSDDGSRLIIDNNLVIDNDGTHRSAEKQGSVHLTPGMHSIRVDYFQGPRLHVALVLQVQPPLQPLKIFNMNDFR